MPLSYQGTELAWQHPDPRDWDGCTQLVCHSVRTDIDLVQSWWQRTLLEGICGRQQCTRLVMLFLECCSKGASMHQTELCRVTHSLSQPWCYAPGQHRAALLQAEAQVCAVERCWELESCIDSGFFFLNINQYCCHQFLGVSTPFA